MQATASKAEGKPDLRQAILRAAQDLFLEAGYEQFSMRRLARRVGYSPTTLYIYFRDKRDLIYSLCEDLFQQYLAELKQVAEAETDSLERLKKLFLLSTRFGCRHQDHYRVAFFSQTPVYGRPEDFMSRDSLARRSYFFIRQVVADCIAARVLRSVDPDLVTQALLTASHGVVTAYIFWKDFPLAPPEILAETILGGLLEGFKA
jgi:AcrR family transcriptional regulator